MRREIYEECKKRLLSSKYLLVMKFRCDAVVWSKLGNDYSDAGHIKCPLGPHSGLAPQAPHPCTKLNQITNATCPCYASFRFIHSPAG